MAATLSFRVVLAVLSFLVVLIDQLRPVVAFTKVHAKSRLVSLFIIISTTAPRIGRYIQDHDVILWRLRSWYDDRIGDEMVEVRDDISYVFSRNRHFNDPPTRGELLADIGRTKRKIRRRHSYGEMTIAAIGGGLTLIISQIHWLWGVGIAITVYLILMPISLFARDVVVDTLAYSEEMVDPEREEVRRIPVNRLMFHKGWNEILLRKESSIHRFIFVGIIRGKFVEDYEKGIELMESVVAGETELEDALDNLIEEEFGNETWEERTLSKFTRWFYGID